MENKIQNQNSIFTKKILVYLFTILLIGLGIRIWIFPNDLPLTLDAFTYFSYANDVKILGALPTSYIFPNNGWPLILSGVFYFVDSANFLDYTNLQRILTMIISVCTVFPVYLLCTKFFENKYAVIGSAFFILEPRIILNSVLGTTETLFVFLSILSLALFLSNNSKMNYIAFGLAAFASIIRYEGVLLIIPFSIMYIWKIRREKANILKYFLGLGIFILVILPFTYLRMETIGQDGLVSHISAGVIVSNHIINEENGLEFLIDGISNLIKYVGWVQIPTLILFTPLGIFLFFRKIDWLKTNIILFFITMLVPALYAYVRNIQDPRYLFVILPIFSLVALFFVEKISVKNKHTILIIILVGIITSSVIFIEYKKPNYDEQIEAYKAAIEINKIAKVINEYEPQSAYIRLVGLEDGFPKLINAEMFGPKVLSSTGFSTIEEYISINRNENLDSLVLDGKDNREDFLNDVYHNEENYPYLEKIYESKNKDYKIKVFKINYELFDQIIHN